MNKSNNDLGKLPLNELKAKLGFNSAGLSDALVKKSQDQYGLNELPEKKVNPILLFLSYFWGPIAWMIEIAGILSAVVKHWEDFYIILVLLVVNAIVGFWEEFHAAGAIAALKSKLALKAKVKRNGKWQSIPAKEIVPGDIIHLRLGDIIPADAKLLEDSTFEIDQSTLTGESLPVTKKQGEDLFSGAIIRRGEGEALVYATGVHTFFGKTAQLMQEDGGQSHFQKAILKIGNYLILVAVVLVAIILIFAFFRGDPMLEMIQFALILTVAAIPVAMPTVLSVTMAVGSRVLAKKEAIVTRLVAIEELAGMDILCSDKTGTLTQNKLKMGKISPLSSNTEEQVITAAAYASKKEDEDPIDNAILAGLNEKLPPFEIIHFTPFDPVSKRTEITLKNQEGIHRFSKGAPQAILDLIENKTEIEKKVEAIIQEFADRGFRSLGVAQASENGNWQYLGIIPLYDPPREDSKETIRKAHEMGIDVKMVTGDQVAIGKEVAKEVGLGLNILNAESFSETDPVESSALSDTIEEADGFGQVFPEHKYNIVSSLQKRNHIVGMTGDGVNDAPALKKADTGIAVSGATDAARAAADIVLLRPGLSVIIDAIKESRKIFQRMNSYVIYRIAETIRVLLFMTLSILVFNFYPVTAVMIVLLALLNDGAILTIAYDRVVYSNLPEKWELSKVLSISTILGICGVISSFGLFYIAEQIWQFDRDTVQSLMYLKLSVAGHLTIFVTRTRGPFWSVRPSKVLFLAVMGTQIIATLIAVYGMFMTPIGWKMALIVWAYALAFAFFNDRVKLVTYRFLYPKE